MERAQAVVGKEYLIYGLEKKEYLIYGLEKLDVEAFLDPRVWNGVKIRLAEATDTLAIFSPAFIPEGWESVYPEHPPEANRVAIKWNHLRPIDENFDISKINSMREALNE